MHGSISWRFATPTLSKTKQLVELVADNLSDALHPENVTIFLDDEDTGAYVIAFSSDASKAGVALPSRPPVLKFGTSGR